MEQFERIIRECFLDSRITVEELQGVLKSGPFKEKKQLSERILLNSSRYLLDLKLFDKDELAALVEEYRLMDGVMKRVFAVESEFYLTGGV